MSATFKITGEHNITAKTELFRKAIKNAMVRISEVHVAASKRVYLAKKKASPKLPSMIFDSFTYELKSGSKTEIVGVVTCGGLKAPHAIYVNYPRRLRNGKVWPGYHFMETGALFARSVSRKIIEEELVKVSRG